MFCGCFVLVGCLRGVFGGWLLFVLGFCLICLDMLLFVLASLVGLLFRVAGVVMFVVAYCICL